MATDSNSNNHSDATSEPVESVDLRRYSLNGVVTRNPSLWTRPLQWTESNHLRALCVERQTGVATGGIITVNTLIPSLDPCTLGCLISTVRDRDASSLAKVMAWNDLLVFDGHAQGRTIRLAHGVPSIETSINNSTGPGVNTAAVPVPFSAYQTRIMKLRVGRGGAYQLPRLSSWRVGPSSVLCLLDSFHISGVVRSHRPLRSYEPCIAAVLIALAQTAEGTDRHLPLQTTHLLFINRNDENHVHVYTAYISRALLRRFQLPNCLPPRFPRTAPLAVMQHRRVMYHPLDTFRSRILTAVSMGTTTMNPDDYFGG
ncbi:hypothetical protein F4777DRAFT_23962 [Nemania sp. FL0916]|nr:hypothetical protein F4777DRAFT_23962 [Nemania sp. FL0916]